MTLARRAWLLVAATLTVAALIYLALHSGHAVPAFALPVMVAVYLMCLVHYGYFILRELKWRRRREVEREALAQVAIPPDVPRPSSFQGVKEIDEAQHRLLPPIPDYQGTYFARGIRIALLPAIAIVFAAAQNSFAGGTPFEMGLIGAEVIVLFTILWLVWINPEPVKAWLSARVRAELMRREQYLRLACAGPYLGLAPDAATRRTHSRIIELRDADPEQLRQLISMNGEPQWLDQIWRRPTASLPVEGLADRMRSYLYYRIDKQIMWFGLGTAAKEKAEWRTAGVVKTVLVLAILGGMAQMVLVSQQPEPNIAVVLVSFASLVLPAACVLLLGVQQVLSYQRLALSYAETRRELLASRAALSDLIDELHAVGDGGADEIGRRFQSLVLRLENELTQELLRWIMFIRRSEFEVAL
jgi:hypothetical protein